MIYETNEDMCRKNTAIKVLSYDDMQNLLMAFKKEPGLILGDYVEGDIIDILENAMYCMHAVMVEGREDGEKAAVTAAEITVRSVLNIISSYSYKYIVINCIIDENISFDTFLEAESFIKRTIVDLYDKSIIFMLTVKSDIISNFALFDIIISGVDSEYINHI